VTIVGRSAPVVAALVPAYVERPMRRLPVLGLLVRLLAIVVLPGSVLPARFVLLCEKLLPVSLPIDSVRTLAWSTAWSGGPKQAAAGSRSACGSGPCESAAVLAVSASALRSFDVAVRSTLFPSELPARASGSVASVFEPCAAV